jgi:hypothetical protein
MMVLVIRVIGGGEEEEEEGWVTNHVAAAAPDTTRVDTAISTRRRVMSGRCGTVTGGMGETGIGEAGTVGVIGARICCPGKSVSNE